MNNALVDHMGYIDSDMAPLKRITAGSSNILLEELKRIMGVHRLNKIEDLSKSTHNSNPEQLIVWSSSLAQKWGELHFDQDYLQPVKPLVAF